MATTDRLSGFNIGVAVKPACAVTTTGANITLQGAQTIDGISVGSCERVLVQDQTDATENGIYLADSSTWIRARDFDGAKDAIPGTLVYVDRGTLNATSFWAFNSSSTATKITIGTDNVTVSRVTVALSGVTAFSNSLLALASTTAWKSTDGLNLGSAADVNIGNSSTNLGLLTSTGLQFVGIQSWNKGGDLASANNMTLGSTGNYFDVTGGTTINTIAAVRIGTQAGLHFDSTLVLTHSTALVLPTSANILVQAGDEAEFVQYTTGADWRVRNYQRASGLPLAVLDEDTLVSDSSSHVPTQQSVKAYVDAAGWRHSASLASTSSAATFSGIPAGVTEIHVTLTGVEQDTANSILFLQIGDGGGLESSGYTGKATIIPAGTGNQIVNANSTAFNLTDNTVYDANQDLWGRLALHHHGSNLWSLMGTINHGDHGSIIHAAGLKTLTDELDRLSLAMNTTALFTAGTVYITAR